MTNEQYSSFRFENYRAIPGADYRDEKVWSQPWLQADQFSNVETRQLEDILGEWEISGDPFAIPCGDFQGLAEVGFERWDVIDSDGNPAYMIWTYTDSGMIYRYGTTERVGQIIQWDAEFDDEDLGQALEASRIEAKKRNPEAPLPRSLEPD